MPELRNIFACLVHESAECVVDLVRNLRFVDPTSEILLYNGGPDPTLLQKGFPFERYDATVVPNPRRMNWGKLHDFALDCMRFALGGASFHTLTIVDSDQLGLRAGYSAGIAEFLTAQPHCGLLGSTEGVHPASSGLGPVRAAWAELELWRPLLRRFPEGESRFVHWTFWPSTVFTFDACRALVQLFAADDQLKDILTRSQLWATEEILFPTLVALLGFEVRRNPCSSEYVRFRERFTPAHVDQALQLRNAYWMHPVARKLNDPVRLHIARRLCNYEQPLSGGNTVSDGNERRKPPRILQTLPILARMRQVEGWLDDAEGDLLLASAARALNDHGASAGIVEIGSYCGRSTTVLGCAVEALCPDARVFAVDPHDGKVGSDDTSIQTVGPSFDRFQRNLAAAGITECVVPIRKCSFEVEWSDPISLLLVDGLHDYTNVARDFFHFEQHVVPGGLVAFHDYADYYPGVKAFVNEVLATGFYQRVAIAASLIVVQKVSEGIGLHTARAAVVSCGSRRPLVSCIMATADRRPLVPRAIEYFLRQDYPNKELVIVDDGSDSIADLVVTGPSVRYIRLDRRLTMGAKHNLATEAARGEIILHWDDDDWMATGRISYQVSELEKQPGLVLSGLARLLFFEPVTTRSWEYIYPQDAPPWVAGGTFCYRKELLLKQRFQDVSEGADTLYAWNLKGAAIHALDDNRFYVATVHSRNTSPKRVSDSRWTPCPTERVRELMGEDWSFYEAWPALG